MPAKSPYTLEFLEPRVLLSGEGVAADVPAPVSAPVPEVLEAQAGFDWTRREETLSERAWPELTGGWEQEILSEGPSNQQLPFRSESSSRPVVRQGLAISPTHKLEKVIIPDGFAWGPTTRLIWDITDADGIPGEDESKAWDFVEVEGVLTITATAA